MRFVAVEFEAKRAKARGFEPTLHDFECSQLFGNEEHLFPVERGGGNEVRDGRLP
jgi:hypothetical protein